MILSIVLLTKGLHKACRRAGKDDMDSCWCDSRNWFCRFTDENMSGKKLDS